MEHAWIAGQPATLDAAIEGAAKLLASSRCLSSQDWERILPARAPR